MSLVTAYTSADPDRDLPPRKVQGELKTHYVPTLDYTQYFVGGVLVDGNTIRNLPTKNVFCPTGVGGGIKPDCSPDSKSVEVNGHLIEVVTDPSRQHLQNLLKNSRQGELRGIAYKDKVHVFDRENDSGEEVFHDEVAKALGHSGDRLPAGNRFVVTNYGESYGGTTIETYAGGYSSQSMREANPAILQWGKKLGLTVNTVSGVLNVFCPTGAGGGVDPTCAKTARTPRIRKAKAPKTEEEPPKASTEDLPKLSAESIRDLMKDAPVLQQKVEEAGKKYGAAWEKHEKTIDRILKADPEDLQRLSQEIGTSTAAGMKRHVDSLKKEVDSTRAEWTKSTNAAQEPRAKVSSMMEKEAVNIGDVNRHGMTEAEKMKSVKIDGVHFSWSEKTENQARSTIINVFGEGNKIPKSLWNANHEIIFSSQQNNKDHFWAKEYGISNFRSNATGGDGSICSYNNPLAVSSVAHESGHNLAFRTWGNTHPPHDSDYGKAQKEERPVSDYGAKSPAEDFAEACKLYTTERQSMQQTYPKKYAALKAILRE